MYVLGNRVLAMEETPVKAGVEAREDAHGGRSTGRPTRSCSRSRRRANAATVEAFLGDFDGVLSTDTRRTGRSEANRAIGTPSAGRSPGAASGKAATASLRRSTRRLARFGALYANKNGDPVAEAERYREAGMVAATERSGAERTADWLRINSAGDPVQRLAPSVAGWTERDRQEIGPLPTLAGSVTLGLEFSGHNGAATKHPIAALEKACGSAPTSPSKDRVDTRVLRRMVVASSTRAAPFWNLLIVAEA